MLRALETRAKEDLKRTRSDIVARLTVEHDQYRRYLRADTALRLDQLAEFADALGTTEQALREQLGIGPHADGGWSVEQARDYLIAEGLPPEHVESRLDVISDLKPLSRRG